MGMPWLNHFSQRMTALIAEQLIKKYLNCDSDDENDEHKYIIHEYQGVYPNQSSENLIWRINPFAWL